MKKETLDRYLKVKNGQDLVDLGIIPKNSSEHMAVITRKRLEVIRDNILANLSPEMLGSWIPAMEPIIEDRSDRIKKGRVKDSEEIIEHLHLGMRVRGKGKDVEYDGLEGTIVCYDKRNWNIDIEFDKVENGSDLNGWTLPGKGYTLKFDDFDLLAPEGKVVTGYKLKNGVVADKQLGHKIIFTRDYSRNLYDDEEHRIDGAIPKGTVATLLDYDPERSVISIRTESRIPDQGNRIHYKLHLNFVHDSIQVSSLGQIAPMDKESEVKKQTLVDFFPKTVLEEEVAENIVKGLLMGKDMIFYGPPGGGKTNVARDILDIFMQQELIFTVDGCQVQCNPYSLFDEDFAKNIPPCPECMIKYDKEFKFTGRFTRPRPKDVKVVVAKCGEGKGVEHTEGTVGLSRMHLTGYKLPKLDGSTSADRENDYDPEGFKPGVLARTNNGSLHMDEIDKLRPQALDNILEALNSDRVKPDQLRFSYPAHALVFGTANDPTVFSQAINDRMVLLAIRYPENEDTSYGISRSSYHNDFNEVDSVEVGDTHRQNGHALRKIPMPVIIERAVDSIYMKLRKEYEGPGKNEISGSNRCKFDALDAARACWLIDQMFYDETSLLPGADYAVKGIQYAVCSRVQQQGERSDKESKSSLNQWVKEQFMPILEQEEKTWWCRVYKNVAVAATQVPQIEGNFNAELASYAENMDNVLINFDLIKRAYENPKDDKLYAEKAKHPFMDYLFKEQPHFESIKKEQLLGMVGYYLASKKRSQE